MRGLKLLLTSLTLLAVLCTPALAQNSPAASQYDAKTCPNGAVANQQEDQTTADVGDGACTAADNVGQGTDAVNDALGEPDTASDVSTSGEGSSSPESSASAPGEAVSPESAASPEAGDTADAGAGLASITELPETGGVSPALPALGVLLVAVGLLFRASIGR